MIRKQTHILALLTVILAGGGSFAAEKIVEEALTKPSKDRTISFIRPGLVAKVFVKDDDVVKKGQLLAKLEDAAEQIQLQQLRATSEDTTEIEAEEAQLKHARVELKLKEDALKNKVAPELEVMRAATQVKIAEARVEIAKFKNRINKLRYQEAKLQLERMELRSPIDGIVEDIVIDEGEAVDTQMKPVLRIINIDPMWVEANVPTRQARKFLKKGQVALVSFSGGTTPQKGKIIKVASDADSDSDTVRVRIELPNPKKRGTGETVTVEFVPVSTMSTKKSIKKPSAAADKASAAPAKKKNPK